MLQGVIDAEYVQLFPSYSCPPASVAAPVITFQQACMHCDPAAALRMLTAC